MPRIPAGSRVEKEAAQDFEKVGADNAPTSPEPTVEVVDVKLAAEHTKPERKRYFEVFELCTPRIGGKDYCFKPGEECEAPEHVFLLLKQCGKIKSSIDYR